MAYNGDTFTMIFLGDNVQLSLMVSPRIATDVCKVFCPEAGPSLDKNYQGKYLSQFTRQNKGVRYVKSFPH